MTSAPFSKHERADILRRRAEAQQDYNRVIGELEMDPGWSAYPIVYFSNPKPAAELLSHDWCQTMYSYVSSTGQPETSYPNDPWDFELEPWLALGKLMWCVPSRIPQGLARTS
ncbi:MAG TPA: hypothetical protein VER12_02695, partial [Polyangiaceae bacterium]|nr:hypothetical protein [Polyangiaceae bacterium]